MLLKLKWIMIALFGAILSFFILSLIGLGNISGAMGNIVGIICAIACLNESVEIDE